MAQQIFDKHWPLGKNGANELIPGAAILQTRDGKDEPITLSASFQLGEGGLFLPTGKDNPLETRVRELERLIGEIAATPTPNTLQARLKEIADRLGEAVASPNEHTLLARLKAVEEELEAVKDALTSGDAKVTLTGQLPQPVDAIPVNIRGALHLMHEYRDFEVPSAGGSLWQGFGATTASSATTSALDNAIVPVDTRYVSKLFLYVENQGSGSLVSPSVRYFTIPEGGASHYLRTISLPSVPVGATLDIVMSDDVFFHSDEGYDDEIVKLPLYKMAGVAYRFWKSELTEGDKVTVVWTGGGIS